MNDHVVAVLDGGLLHVTPAQRHRPAGHGLAAEFFLVMVHHAGLIMHFARRQHGVGVDHDATEIVVPVQAQLEHRQAGLGRYGQRHLVRDPQPMGAAELLAVQAVIARQLLPCHLRHGIAAAERSQPGEVFHAADAAGGDADAADHDFGADHALALGCATLTV